MAIAQGVFKQTRFKRQTAKGTIATTASGQILRRQTTTFEQQRDTFNSADEINSTQQLISQRLGAKLINAQISGLLSPGTYSDLLAALLRRDFTAVSNITAATLSVAASGSNYTITRSAGSWITDGIKAGMVIRATAGLNVNSRDKNLFVVSVGSATVITVAVVNGTTLTVEAAVAGCTVTVPGKVTWAAASSHTSIYYTFEEWFPDVPFSERFQDCRVGSAQITMPGQGNATIQMDVQGLDYSSATTVYFSAPTAETSSETCAGVSGSVMVSGVSVANLTDINFTITANQSPADPVVGSNVRPDLFVGKIMVSGTFSCYFDSTTYMDAFVNETDASLAGVLANGSLAASDFVSFALYKLNITSAQPADGETGLKRTYNFTAEYFTTNATTILIQDSLAA